MNLAYCRAHSGEIVAALADFETLLADQERVLQPEHPGLQPTRDWIASLRQRLESPPDADGY